MKPIIILIFLFTISTHAQTVCPNGCTVNIGSDGGVRLVPMGQPSPTPTPLPVTTSDLLLSLDDPAQGQTFPRLTTIRTIYMVVNHTTGLQDYAALLGDLTAYDFHGGVGSQLFSPLNASLFILNGQTYWNGLSISPLSMSKPSQLTVIAIVTTGNVTASNIGTDRGLAARQWSGSVKAVRLYGSAHDEAKIQATTATLMAQFGVVQSPLPAQLVLDGNSQVGEGFQSEINKSVGAVSIRNLAIPGQTTAQMLQNVSQVTALYDPRRANIYFPFEIRNDLATGANADTAFTHYANLCSVAKSAGYQVIAATIPASNSLPDSAFRLDVNNLIRTHWREFASCLVDIGGDLRLADFTNQVYFFSDGIHLTLAGDVVVGELYRNRIC